MAGFDLQLTRCGWVDEMSEKGLREQEMEESPSDPAEQVSGVKLGEKERTDAIDRWARAQMRQIAQDKSKSIVHD